MAANFLQPKGSVKKTDNKAAIDEFAKQSSTLEAEANKNNAEDLLRNATASYLLKNIESPVNVPKVITLKDVLTSNDRLGSLADYISTNPDFAGLVGGLIGGSKWDKDQNQVYAGDIVSKLKEDRLNRDRDTALAQQEQQNKLAGMTYKEFNDMDVANMQNELMRDKLAQELDMFGQKLAFERKNELYDRNMAQQRMNELIRHNRAMENKSGSGSGADDLGEVQEQLNKFTDSFDTVDNPYRYRIFGGASNLANTLTPQESNFNSQRTLLFNQIARKLGGEKGVLSDQDIQRIDAALPKLSDTKQQKMAKMRAVYNLLDIRKGNEIGSSYDAISNKEDGVNIDQSAVDAEMKRRGFKK